MKILVTGCNGRLGTAVCRTLVGAGHMVAGIDAVAAPDRTHPVLVDTLMDPFAFHRGLALLGGSVDAVVHLANHIHSLAAPAETVLRENLAMNSSVFVGAWQAGARRVVFASSVQAMLGGAETDGSPNARPPAQLPINEAYPARPTNVYGLSKVLSERMLDHLCDVGAFSRPFSAISLRLPYILIPKAFEANVVATTPSHAMWGSSEGFAYIAVEDAADLVRRAVEADTPGHEIVWAAAPDPRSPESVVQLIDRFYAGVPGADAARAVGSLVDSTKAHRLLGWSAGRLLRDERARRSLARTP